MTIFEKIVRGEIPADIVWEDADVLAFRDVNPQAPVHVLIVPKRVVPRLAEATPADEALLGKLLLAARTVAEKLDLQTSGYRVVINSGPDAGETLTVIAVSAPASGTAAFSALGVTYTPGPSFTSLSEGETATDSATADSCTRLAKGIRPALPRPLLSVARQRLERRRVGERSRGAARVPD